MCVLVSWSGAQEIDDSAPCDIFIQDSNNLTLNCSRRNIDIIPEWPKQLNDFEKGKDYREQVYLSPYYQRYDAKQITALQSKFYVRAHIFIFCTNKLFFNLRRIKLLCVCNNIPAANIFNIWNRSQSRACLSLLSSACGI